MLSRPHRLPASEIKNILRSKERFSSREFHIVFAKNNLTVSRFAVVVSNKIDKRATVRNRTKRLIRESARHLLPRLVRGRDVVIIAKKALGEIGQSQAQKIVQEAFSRGSLFNNATM